LLAGAGLNVLLNFLLIPLWGIEGAAVSTLVGYACSVIAIAIVTKLKKLLQIKPRFLASSLVVLGVFFVNRFFQFSFLGLLAFSGVGVFLILVWYVKDLRGIIQGGNLFRKGNGRNK